MKKLYLYIILIWFLNLRIFAEMEFDSNQSFSIAAETIKISKKGVLMGEYNNNLTSNPYNGLYFDDSGNLNFKPKTLQSFKITDIDEDESYYYVTSYMTQNGLQGLFKISKDFSKVENIGIKASLKKVLQYKNKVYTGGYVHGCYVINKDGSNQFQIIGDGYYGPQIDDIKANSKNIYVLSRGLLYKIDYETNNKELIQISQRPSFIELDEDRIYASAYNKFFYLSYDNKISNEKTFYNKISFLKKHQNLIILAESDSTNTYFWISDDKGLNFYKSKTKLPISKTIKDIEIVGDKIYTIYFNLANQGIIKAKLNFDFEEKKIFNPPFTISKDSDLVDKITSFFDHRYPYLGNKTELEENKYSTLNYEGKELKEPYLYYSSHDGIDWGLPINTPIYSVDEGIASYFYQAGGLGHTIKISHPNGYISIYGHLSEKELVTNTNPIYVSALQKIGKVGMSGNTSGPHLHFTTYKGEKMLTNKVDPFGWGGNFPDPWEIEGSKSLNLWKTNPSKQSFQINPNQNITYNNDILSINTINLSFLSNPINFEIENVPPIYDLKNYLYFKNTSYQIKAFDLESKTIPQSILGLVRFSGFKTGDDKFYSIWKIDDKNVEKLTTVYDSDSSSLSTIFTPNAQYLILKDNFKKIRIKGNTYSN